jgi:hypothetical protein
VVNKSNIRPKTPSIITPYYVTICFDTLTERSDDADVTVELRDFEWQDAEKFTDCPSKGLKRASLADRMRGRAATIFRQLRPTCKLWEGEYGETEEILVRYRIWHSVAGSRLFLA